MKLIKRLGIFLVLVAVLLITSAILIPILFKDKITEFAKVEINNSINAKVDFDGVSLSLFKNFPNLRFALQNFSVEGVDQFDGINLAKANSFDLVLDLGSVISSAKPLQLKSIYVDQPVVNVLVLENGEANYNIAKPDTVSTSPTANSEVEGFVLQLNKYTINDAVITYDDRQTNTFLNAKDLDHSGFGEFTLDVFDLATKTEVQDLTIKYGGISYLVKSEADLEATFNIDQNQTKYTLKDNRLKINDLLLNADGFIQLEDEKIHLDLSLSTPQNNFKSLLSLIPNAYIQDYQDVKANGAFDFEGLVKGTYDAAKELYPAFDFKINVENGNVQYPDLPLGISDINTNIAIKSPSSNLNDMIVDASNFNLKIGNNPIKGRFALKTPISDPDVNTQIAGTLDLDALSKAFPIEGVKKMSGTLVADILAQTKMSYIDRGMYDRVYMKGDFGGERILYDSEDYPVIAIKNIAGKLSPQKATLSDFDARFGKSDLKLAGTIDNILAYFSPTKTMKGNLKVTSNLFDANEWIPETEQTASTSSYNEPVETTEKYEVFDRFDFLVDGQINEILYDEYDLKNLQVNGHLLPNKLTVSNLSGQLKDSDFQASGQINNIFKYLFEQGTLTGDIVARSNSIDLNQFMVSTEVESPSNSDASEEVPMEVVMVPEHINMNIRADVGTVLYGKLKLNNVQGLLAVANQSVVLDNVTANGLGGKMVMSGSYDTPVNEEPAFNIKYDLSGLDFQKTFDGVNTFQALAPIAKFINGNFSSSLILNSKLGKDLMPILGTISAKGYLETINGVVNDFKPLQIIGNTLDINELKNNTPLAKTKNWFEIKDGTVTIQEFDYALNDISMKISGTHTLDQQIKYTIKAKVPKAKLGNSIGKGINLISGQANKLGLNIGEAKFVNLGINLNGAMQDPKIAVKFLGLEGEGESQIEDIVTETAKDKVADVKEQVETQKDQAIDSIKSTVDQKVEEAKAEVKKKAKDILGKEIGNTLDSTLLSKGDSTKVDDIRKELEKWNPFKKKKKKGN